MLPESLLACLGAFEPCFTSPSYRRFVTLMAGWLLCVGKHTVTGVMRAAGVATSREHSGYQRFFSRGAWCPDEVGMVVARMVLGCFARDGRVTLSLDDTLARHTGKHVALGGMHHDPLTSTAKKARFHFGHVWVVLAVVVEMPWGKRLSLPVMARLYRTEKVNAKLGRSHEKKTELGAAMLMQIAAACPEHTFFVVADAAYVNRAVIRHLPRNVELVGRGRLDAAVYAQPARSRTRGRPRVRGERVLSPEKRAKRGRWVRVDAVVYGRSAVVRVQVFDVLWYVVGKGRVLRFVLIADWPGHKKLDVLVATDVSMSAAEIIEQYCHRWTLEETFGWVKSRLGLEDPHNRTERAVERTAPMALWTYSLVVLWYAKWSSRRTRLPIRRPPWQRTKSSPSFADMLATLRRESWRFLIDDQVQRGRLDHKSLEPLLEIAGYG